MPDRTDACYLDANVLVYFKNEDAPQFPHARALLERLVVEEARLCVSPLVLDEFLFAVRALVRRGKAPRTALVRRALEDVLTLPGLTILSIPVTLGAQREAVSYMEQFSLRPRDAYHVVTARAHGISHFATFDSDFKGIFRAGLLAPYR